MKHAQPKDWPAYPRTQITINGSSQAGLGKQVYDILQPLHEARTLLCASAPHGRDYQLEPSEWRKAREAWQHSLDTLDALIAQQTYRYQEIAYR